MAVLPPKRPDGKPRKVAAPASPVLEPATLAPPRCFAQRPSKDVKAPRGSYINWHVPELWEPIKKAMVRCTNVPAPLRYPQSSFG